jgi:hypothetical protein
MRFFAVLCAVCLLAGCGSDQAPRSQPQVANPAPAQGSSSEPPEHLLLAASAKDFHTHQPPYPERFRDVRFGHIVRPDGTKMYLLSGQFQPTQAKVEPEWTPFATIKTSDYEQLLGAQAKSYCEQPSIVWESQEDLSGSLKDRLDSFR